MLVEVVNDPKAYAIKHELTYVKGTTTIEDLLLERKEKDENKARKLAHLKWLASPASRW